MAKLSINVFNSFHIISFRWSLHGKKGKNICLSVNKPHKSGVKVETGKKNKDSTTN